MDNINRGVRQMTVQENPTTTPTDGKGSESQAPAASNTPTFKNHTTASEEDKKPATISAKHQTVFVRREAKRSTHRRGQIQWRKIKTRRFRSDVEVSKLASRRVEHQQVLPTIDEETKDDKVEDGKRDDEITISHSEGYDADVSMTG